MFINRITKSIKPIIFLPRRNYLKYIDDKSCHLVYNNNKVSLNDGHIKTNSLLATIMLINKNKESLGRSLKSSVEIGEFRKIKETENNVEFICSEGIPINTEMEKAYDNDKYMSMIVNVDTISTESKDLIAETKVRVYFHPVI